MSAPGALRDTPGDRPYRRYWLEGTPSHHPVAVWDRIEADRSVEKAARLDPNLKHVWK
jgi:hypothetical protein